MEILDTRVHIALRKTQPWIRFFSVLCFIWGGLIALAPLMVFGSGFEVPSALLLGSVVLYLLMALLYFVPGRHLWRFANSIGEFVLTESIDDMARAMEFQMKFWRFIGVAFIVFISTYLTLVLGFFILG